MSTNVCIIAERPIMFKKRGGTICSDIQTNKFPSVQTPTDISYKIVESKKPIQAYIDYIRSLSQVEEPSIYIWVTEHEKELLKWISEVEEKGYTIKVEII